MIVFSCPGCAKNFSTEDDRAGHAFQCPVCYGQFLVPQHSPVVYQPPAFEIDPPAEEEESPRIRRKRSRRNTPPDREEEPESSQHEDQDTEEWYYSEKGNRYGPYTWRAMKKLVDRGEILEDTPVWDGYGNWKPAWKTDLFRPRKEARRRRPPPLPSDHVDNRFAWLMAGVPVLGGLIELAVNRQLLVLWWLANTGLAYVDKGRLRAAGHKAPNDWWIWILIPAYLWQRAANLRQSQHIFIVWCASFVVSIVIAINHGPFAIEDTAKDLVTQIVRTQLQGNAKCDRVRITSKLGNGNYRAIAEMNNGRSLNILITVTGNQVYVEIPYQ